MVVLGFLIPHWTTVYNHCKLRPLLPARSLDSVTERWSGSTVEALDQDCLGANPVLTNSYCLYDLGKVSSSAK